MTRGLIWKRFALATEARPTIQRADKVKEEVEEAIVRELKFAGTKPRKMPDFDKNEANIKLNVAALKREKHLMLCLWQQQKKPRYAHVPTTMKR